MRHENEVAASIVDAALKVHRVLGPGLFESVYEMALSHELVARELGVERQVPIPVVYGGVQMEAGFRADLIVDRLVLVELKSVERTSPMHKKQALTYTRLAGLRLGLLLNFGQVLMRDGITRLAWRL